MEPVRAGHREEHHLQLEELVRGELLHP